MATKLDLYTAKVISINDTDKRGKIQIRILPELKGVDASLLPWAIPFLSSQGVAGEDQDLPEENSLVWCLVDSRWKRFYYLKNRFFEKVFSFSEITSALSVASEISNPNYKDLKFRLYKDGGLEFHNNNTGEHGFIHKSGSYQVFDSNGKIIIHGVGSQPVLIQGKVNIYGKDQTLKLYNDLNTLREIIVDLQTVATHLTTASTLTAPSGGGPVIYSHVVDDGALLTNLSTKITNLLGS